MPPCSRFWRRTFSRVHAEMSGDRAWIYGASSWFAIVKQCLDLDYDALLYRANNDLLLRELLGHGEAGFDAVKYSRQRLVDNVQLLTPELVLIHLIVRTGHKVAGKKSGVRQANCQDIAGESPVL